MKLSIKSRYVLFCLFLGFLTACIDDGAVSPDVVTNGGIPTLGKMVVGEPTASGISLEGEVEKANGYPVTERGFCWGTNPSPKIKTDFYLPVEKGVGRFSAKIENLQQDTTYYVCVYAINRIDTIYSDPKSFRTKDGKGVLRTLIIDSISAKTAIVGGKIESHGEGAILRRGVYYSESENMANKDSVLSLMEADSFVCNIPCLPSTKYYVQAFVENTFGKYYGLIQSFTTGDGRPVVDTIISIIIRNANVDQVVSQIINQGSAPVTRRGFCYGILATPTLENSQSVDVDPGQGEGTFVNIEPIENLEPERLYYICSFAKNEFGITYGKAKRFNTGSDKPRIETLKPEDIINGSAVLGGKIIDEGKSDITKTGVCYSSVHQEPTISDEYAEITPPLSLSAFSIKVSGLQGRKTYYVRAFATNNQGTSYGEVQLFETPPIFNNVLALFTGANRIEGSPAYFMIGNKCYLLGGDLGKKYTSELWSYSNLSGGVGKWNQYNSYSAGELKWQTAVGYKISAFVIGGMDSSYKVNDDFREYIPLSNRWYDRPKGPDSACLRVGFSLSDEICYVGGMKDTAKNDVWVYNVNQSTWSQKENFPVMQYGGIAVTIANTAYVGLGKNTSGVCNKRLWRLSGAFTSWLEEPIYSGISGGILVGVAYKNKIYVIDESYYIIEYDPSIQQWTRKSLLPQELRGYIVCMYVINDLIYIGLNGGDGLITYEPLWDN